jgi:6,7-dimethyl-8-ribityllumazine synthase
MILHSSNQVNLKKSTSSKFDTDKLKLDTKIRIAIVASEFNRRITSQMLQSAHAHAIKINAAVKYVCYVPGSFDMPLIIQQLLKKKDVDAVVALGAVIKGETGHDVIVAENAARLIADLSVKHGKPVALGITGPDMTFEQALARTKIVPLRAVNAAVKMVIRMKKIRNAKPSSAAKVTKID